MQIIFNHTSRQGLELLFWSLLVFMLSVSVIWIRTATVKATYLYSDLEQELLILQDGAQEKRVEWLHLSSSEQLEKLAKQFDLGSPQIDRLLKYESPQSSPRIP